MRRLRLFLAGRRSDGERGAVLVLTACLTMFVAIGLLALTVDIGNITYNRAQLQNGSDAASLALAAACAQPSASGSQCGVTSSLTDLAVKNANVSDQSMTVLTDSRTCVSPNYVGASDLSRCLPPTAANATSLSQCQPLPPSLPASAKYVEVTTQTKTSDSNILPYYFGQLLTGSKGTTQRTCSRAAWGPAGKTGPTIPATMSLCNFNNATGSGTKYADAPAPSYSPAPWTNSKPPTKVQPYITAIFLHNTNSGSTCTDKTNGQTYPGGFGWLQTTNDSDCVADIATGQTAAGDTSGGSNGRSTPNACKLTGNATADCNATPLEMPCYVGQVVTIPIFDTIPTSGTYHIYGVAAFYLAGYVKATPLKDNEAYNHSGVCSSCNGSDTYLWGWFVSSVLPVGSTAIGNGPDLGADIIAPAG